MGLATWVSDVVDRSGIRIYLEPDEDLFRDMPQDYKPTLKHVQSDYVIDIRQFNTDEIEMLDLARDRQLPKYGTKSRPNARPIALGIEALLF